MTEMQPGRKAEAVISRRVRVRRVVRSGVGMVPEGGVIVAAFLQFGGAEYSGTACEVVEDRIGRVHEVAIVFCQRWRGRRQRRGRWHLCWLGWRCCPPPLGAERGDWAKGQLRLFKLYVKNRLTCIGRYMKYGGWWV